MKLLQILEIPFWEKWDFWISTLLSVFGIGLTIFAARQAKKAKEAAQSAAKTVKLQTITIELVEVTQKLDRLSPDIKFSAARDLLNETSRKLRRLISPFKSDSEYKTIIEEVYTQLRKADEALQKVRPEGPEVVSNSVFNALENHFTMLNGTLADLLGLIEKRTLNIS